MSVVITVSNEINLRKLKNFLGAKDENEAVDIVIEKTVRDFEEQSKIADLPDDFFEDYLPKKLFCRTAKAFKPSLKSARSRNFNNC